VATGKLGGGRKDCGRQKRKAGMGKKIREAQRRGCEKGDGHED
jgi:hypothetical protein